VKSLLRFVPFLFLLLAVEPVFPQAGAKPKPPESKTSKPPATPAATAPAQQTSDEVIPPPAPNAIFPALVARVNGKPILGRDMDQIVRRQLAPMGNPEWKNLREDYRAQLVGGALQELISSKLILQKAIASGFKVSDTEVQAEVAEVAKTFSTDAEMNIALYNQGMDRESLAKSLSENLLVTKYVDETIQKKVDVTPEEVSKYFSSNMDKFKHPDLVRTSQIMIILPDNATPAEDTHAKQRAEALLARAKKGEDFAKLAKENSMHASAAFGGDMGYIEKGQVDAVYSDAAFSLPVDGISGVVRTKNGYHIIKVTDRKKEGAATLDEIRTQLTADLKAQKNQAELDKLIEQLESQAKIEILISTPEKPAEKKAPPAK
jgi:peptidyl-prolyl cis-trans isomerase C